MSASLGDCIDDISDEDEAIVCHANKAVELSIPSIGWTTAPITSRSYNHADLHAADAMEWREGKQQRLLTIMDSYLLRPISLAADETEENALTHERHLKSCTDTQFQVSVTPPLKRKRRDSMMAPATSSLYSSVASGPYPKTRISVS